MRFLALAVMAVAVISAAPAARAQAYDPRYPICMKVIQNLGGERIECAYDSMEQCAARASALAATCIVNPFYRGRR